MEEMRAGCSPIWVKWTASCFLTLTMFGWFLSCLECHGLCASAGWPAWQHTTYPSTESQNQLGCKRPWRSSRSRARHTFRCPPIQQEPQALGSLSNLLAHFCQTGILTGSVNSFCISLSINDLIANAWDWSSDSCSGGNYWTPYSALNMAKRLWEGDSVSSKTNATDHQEDTQVVALLLLNIRNVLA